MSLPRAWFCLCCLGLASLVAGCGTDQYHTRLEASLKELKKGEVFYKYLQPTAYNDPTPGIQLRLPLVFDGQNFRTTEDEKKLENGYKVQPPDFKLPAFLYSLEASLLIDNRSKMPMYVYFYMVESRGMKPELALGAIRAIVGRVIKDVPDWQDVTVPTPDGGTKTYKLLTGSGPQKFDPVDQSGPYQDYPGRFDIYFVNTDTHFLIIGWRAPDSVAAQNQFFEAAKAAMGTLVFSGPAPPAPPDGKAGTPAPTPMPGVPAPSPMPMPVAPAPAPMPMPMSVPPAAPSDPAAQRKQASENLRYLSFGLHQYDSSYRRFPPAYTVDPSGKKLFSWRVLILPYIEETLLWNKLHRDEPWDSPHNLPLLQAKMPVIFQSPGVALPPNHTAMLAVVAPPTSFFTVGDQKLVRGSLTDGPFTINLFEAPAAKAVPWYQPDDFVPDANDPANGMFGARPGGMLASVTDGRVIFVPDTFDKKSVAGLLTIGGGEKIDDALLNAMVVPFK